MAVDIGIRVFKGFVVGRLEGCRCVRRLMGLCGALSAMVRGFRLALKCWKSIRVGVMRNGPGSTIESNLIAKAVLKATHDSNLEQATASISALLT